MYADLPELHNVCQFSFTKILEIGIVQIDVTWTIIVCSIL